MWILLLLVLGGCAAKPAHIPVQVYDEHFMPIPQDDGMDCHEEMVSPKEQA